MKSLSLAIAMIALFSIQSFAQSRTRNWSAKIHPNPSNGIVYVKLEGKADELTHINVVDQQGKSVYTNDVENSRVHMIDLRDIPKGKYTVQLMSTNIYMRQPLIIF